MTGPGKTISRVAAAFALEARADAIERMRHPDRIQPHSRLLPDEIELAEARFAAMELRVAAQELLAGIEPDQGAHVADGESPDARAP